MSRKAIWTAVHFERRALADDLAQLSDTDWQRSTMCAGWDVHDVLAHLVDVAKTTPTSFLRSLVRARFDLDAENAEGVRRERRAAPQQTLAEFRLVLDRRTGPPAPLATRLVEEIAHGEDIRRAVGIDRDYPIAAVLPALRYLLGVSERFGGAKERAQLVRLHATDTDFAIGEGYLVKGSALALLLAASGRPVAAAALSGPGAGQFIA